MKGIIGRKVGMTQVFTETGEVIPVTVIEAGPCYVTQVKTEEKDGYRAVQLGFGETKPRKLTKGERGHLKNLPLVKHLREFRLEEDETYAVGDKVDASVFSTGERVDVIGISKGKGFQGGVRRHHFRGGPKTHGASDRVRAPGSIGATTTPGRVLKGLRMAGHMGHDRVTVQNLEVVQVDPERNLLAIRGAVPGPKNELVLVREAIKQG